MKGGLSQKVVIKRGWSFSWGPSNRTVKQQQRRFLQNVKKQFADWRSGPDSTVPEQKERQAGWEAGVLVTPDSVSTKAWGHRDCLKPQSNRSSSAHPSSPTCPSEWVWRVHVPGVVPVPLKTALFPTLSLLPPLAQLSSFISLPPPQSIGVCRTHCSLPSATHICLTVTTGAWRRSVIGALGVVGRDLGIWLLPEDFFDCVNFVHPFRDRCELTVRRFISVNLKGWHDTRTTSPWPWSLVKTTSYLHTAAFKVINSCMSVKCLSWWNTSNNCVWD